MTITKELNTVKDLVVSVLEDYPQARNSDTYLYEKCCERLGAKYISDISKIGLSVISVHKIRQVVQNKDKMYMPTEDAKKKRKVREVEIREYMVAN